MCEMDGSGGGKMPGITLIIIGGKPSMPPGHDMTGDMDMGSDQSMNAPDSADLGEDMSMAAEKSPPKRSMGLSRAMKSQRAPSPRSM